MPIRPRTLVIAGLVLGLGACLLVVRGGGGEADGVSAAPAQPSTTGRDGDQGSGRAPVTAAHHPQGTGPHAVDVTATSADTTAPLLGTTSPDHVPPAHGPATTASAAGDDRDAIPVDHRPTWDDFRTRFPDLDPSDHQHLAIASLRQRAVYGDVLDENEAAAYTAWLEPVEAMHRAVVATRAQRMGLAISGSAPGLDGAERSFALIGFDGGKPLYSWTQNAAAAESTGVNLVRMSPDYDPTVGDAVDGSGLYVNVNDHGEIYDEHPEFQLPNNGGTRVLLVEIPWYSGDRSHMTHCAGTVGAWGYTANLMGMAPRVWIQSHIQQSTSDIAAYGMQYPNQPLDASTLNPRTGLRQMRSVMGTTSLGGTDTSTSRGVYTFSSASFDSILRDYPYYTHFYAAANDGSSYATLGTNHPIAKNVVTIGSVSDTTRDAVGGYTSGGSVSGFSSRGPTFDGRIKPDLTANGEGLTSPDSASGSGGKSGTSMATPNASGSATLLIDYITMRLPGHFVRSSTIKALLVNTATDRGNAGPDYIYGWGIINMKAATDIVKRYAENPATRVVVEDSLAQGQTWTQSYTADGGVAIRVTLAWIDPAGTGLGTTTTDRSSRLVNNLNLRLVAPGGTVLQPFVMPFTTGNGSLTAYDSGLYGAVAVTGDNITDNVEQILVTSPATGAYTLQVGHGGSLQGGNPQPFSLAITGMAASAPLLPVSATISPSVGGTDNLQVTVTGSGFAIGQDLILRRGGSLDARAYGVIPLANQLRGRLDTAALAKGYWDVVVRTPDGQTSVIPNGFLMPIAGGSGHLLPPVITSSMPTSATAGAAFTHTITTSDGDTPAAGRTVVVTGLPGGLSFAADGSGGGTISGTPLTAGSASVAISVTDGSYTAWQIVPLVIVPPGGNTAPVVVTTTLPDAHVGAAYAASVTGTDADGHTLTMALGTRPGWMTGVDQGTGSIDLGGTPTSAGSFSVAITATDGLATTQRSLALTVRPRATLALGGSSTSVSESAGSVTVSVQRTGNDTGTVTVAFATANGSATAGSDYTATSGTLTWLDGDTTAKNIVVPISDDQWTEGNQTFTVTLSAPTGIAMLGTAQTTVTITDNDTNAAPTVTIASPAGTVALTDRTHALTVAATLADDGKPLWGGLSATWSQIAGPVGQTAVFADANSATTAVTFPADGAYALRILVSDGEFYASRDLWVMAGPGDGLGPAGLTGAYWANKTFTGAPSLERIDAAVDFSWSGTPTGTTLPADGFAVRWTGVVVPEFSETYTFFTSTDDGTRLWLDGNLVIDRWINQGTTEYSATRACTAGVPVAVRMEFFDNSGGAVARLLWSSASVAKAVVPNARLRSEAGINAAPVIEPLTAVAAGLVVTLSATVADDGKPTTAAPALLWSRIAGPGSVAFTDPAAADSSATVGMPGVHRFRLRAMDGAAIVHREVEVTVGTGGNLPPTMPTDAAAEPAELTLP